MKISSRRFSLFCVPATAVAVALGLAGCGGGSTGSGGGGNPPVTTYALTVASTNPASGVAITVAPADNNGSSSGSTGFTRTYNAGTTVTLTAPATSGSNTFGSWTGCASTSGTGGATCTVTMNSSTTVTANYTTPAPTVYTLTVDSTDPASGVAIGVSPNDNNSAGNGTTSFTRSYNAGTAVVLTAPATSGGNTFTSWTGCTSTSGTNNTTCNVTLNADTTVTANYATPVVTVYTLTVDSTDPTSGVAITVAPADNNSAGNGSTSFTRSYNAGTAVTLTAPATSGTNTFSSWTGCTSAAANVCTVTLNSDTTVTANYSTPVASTYTLSVASVDPASGVPVGVSPNDVNGSGSGSTGFTRTYDAGTTVTLTAPKVNGINNFSAWTGCTTAVSNVCTVTLNANTAVTATYTTPTTYTLTVDSTDPTSGVAVNISPSDANGDANGTTSFTRTYVAGTAVTLTAPSTGSNTTFSSWSGCGSVSNQTCSITMNGNATVTANYVTNGVTSVTITPSPATVTVGQTQTFTATVQGNGTFSQGVTWSVSSPSGCSDSPGTITAGGLYTSPYPACPTVTVKATSKSNTSISSSVTVTLSAPATANGPSLSVDLGSPTHAISPLIYGVNDYLLDSTSLTQGNFSILRWGGDDTSRYNYTNNVTNSANDYYFENFTGAGSMWPDTTFTGLIKSAATAGVPIVGTANVIGWVSNSNTNNNTTSGYGTSGPACSFQKAAFPNQGPTPSGGAAFVGNCGSGYTTSGSSLNGNDTNTDVPNIAAITSIAEPPPTPPAAGQPIGSSWDGSWVSSVVTQFGQGNPSSGTGKGVSQWDLDNEPEYWDAVHRDVHPSPMTYDEITNGGIGAALAIKTADPTALVSGPVISGWYQYFYSQKDVESGYGTGPCYKPWSNPIDRTAHGGVPLIEYYLQQMKAAQTTYGMRLLDYVDIHAYYAATYNGSSVAFTTAGDTGEQAARLNSTRVFWDPTYTDPNETQPNYVTDAGYSTSCTPPLQSPELIPMLQKWVANDYPGTKTAIDEYNFGGGESINGAIAQADVLGIFGMYGLDKGNYWPTTNYNQQVPINMAFAMYRNYDGNDSTFGDEALTSTTANQGALAVYGAQRTSDGAVTVMVINKTFGALTSTLTLPNLTPTGAAQVYLYSSANINAIVPQSPITLTAPVSPATAYTLTNTFPAQSITLLVIPTE